MYDNWLYHHDSVFRAAFVKSECNTWHWGGH